MRVIRGRAADVGSDRAVTRTLVEHAAETDEPARRVWYPHPQVVFGRRDVRSDGYEKARRHAAVRGFEPVERSVGGRAVAYTGTTLAFARVEPLADVREGIQERYEAATATLQEALASLGVDARRGEPDDSFCPGTHSLQAAGKLVGVAQRVRQDVALVAGVLVVRDHETVAAVLGPVYDALGVPFDPDSVGSVARAGGETDTERVRQTVEEALVGDAAPRVEHVGELQEPEDAK